jgi:hypothetical protein
MTWGMTMGEFNKLVQHIEKHHSPRKWRSGLCVTEVQPAVNMKNGMVRAITFRGLDWEEALFDIPSFADGHDSLYNRCIELLETKKGTYDRAVGNHQSCTSRLWS